MQILWQQILRNADKYCEYMTSSAFTYAIPNSVAGVSLLNHGFYEAVDKLQLMDGDADRAREQLAFQKGVMAIDHPRLCREIAIPRQFSDKINSFNIFQDIDTAFNKPDVTTMSTHSGELLERQIGMIGKIATAAARHRGILMMLGLMKARLRGHYYHGLRTGVLFCSLCEVFDSGSELPLTTRLLAGIIHDVGKLQVPRGILFKSEKLTEEEGAVMTAHDTATEKILKPFDRWLPYLSKIAANHHLTSKVNTSDNPHVERAGVLMRMADIYDALASRRDYKSPFPAEKVARIMFSDGYFPNYPAEVLFLLNAFPCPKSR